MPEARGVLEEELPAMMHSGRTPLTGLDPQSPWRYSINASA